MNKKAGMPFLMKYIFAIIISSFILVSLLIFISQKATGIMALKEITSKEIALVLDLGKPGLNFEIIHDEILKIDKKDKEIFVKKDSLGYSYSFYNKFPFNIEKKNGKTIFSFEIEK